MKHNTTTLEQLLAPSVTALGYEFLGCLHVPQGRHTLLRVYIDSTKGITVSDCERVSRQLSAVLDVEDPIAGTYTLEVSSPGIDRPLFTLDHYRRFLGKKVNIKLHVPIENRRHFKGTLQNIINEKIIINVDGKEFALPLANITRANLLPEERSLSS